MVLCLVSVLIRKNAVKKIKLLSLISALILSLTLSLPLQVAATGSKADGEAFVKAAEAELGYQGGSAYWNKYAEELDSFEQEMQWCAIFVSWCAWESGNGDDPVYMADGCTTMRNYYVDLNQYIELAEHPDYVPQRSDIILFYWDDDYSDVDHIGIVVGVGDGIVQVVEGNCDDENYVGYKEYELDSELIAGYVSLFDKDNVSLATTKKTDADKPVQTEPPAATEAANKVKMEETYYSSQTVANGVKGSLVGSLAALPGKLKLIVET